MPTLTYIFRMVVCLNLQFCNSLPAILLGSIILFLLLKLSSVLSISIKNRDVSPILLVKVPLLLRSLMYTFYLALTWLAASALKNYYVRFRTGRSFDATPQVLAL